MAADLVELRMNVAALKRVDPYIKDILGTATQVALYTFSALKNEWEKTDVEGALFVCSRNGEPYNSILIMNRLNTNNLVEPIVKDLDWQMQAPFLLYRNPRNSIFGIWFYNRDECVKTTYLLETIMESLNKHEKVKQVKKTGAQSGGSGASSTTTTGGAGTDIFSMLSRAQEDFNKTPVKTETPKSSTPRGAPDVTSQSVMDFFAKASNPTPQRIPTGDNEPLQPLLHRLMSNPAHSVEHIEKQQRAVTPQEQSQPQQPVQQQGLSVLRAKSLQTKLDPNRTNGNLLNLDTTPTNGFNFMRISSPTTSTSPRGANNYFLQTVSSDPDPVKTPPLATLLESAKPQLMPPMMFAEPTPPEKEIKEPMTKKQMAQAFMYLLKNDPAFLDKLHEGYVKSFQQSYS